MKKNKRAIQTQTREVIHKNRNEKRLRKCNFCKSIMERDDKGRFVCFECEENYEQ